MFASPIYLQIITRHPWRNSEYIRRVHLRMCAKLKRLCLRMLAICSRFEQSFVRIVGACVANRMIGLIQ